MFTLVLIEDDIAVHPRDLGKEIELTLKEQIEEKYVDRVIRKVGLCVGFYDFIKMEGKGKVPSGSVPLKMNYPKDLPLGIIYPGDTKTAFGEAHFKVVFRLMVFQPKVGEWLVGTILSSDYNEGIKIDLGFFQDVIIPKFNLRAPYGWDKEKQLYAWNYRPDRGPATNYWYELHQLVRFRVTEIRFPEGLEPPPPQISTSVGGSPTAVLPTRRRESPMVVVGAMDRDGLGLCLWWPEDDHVSQVEDGVAPMEDAT